VLDVEIDVGWFCALDAQEALEQEVHANGIDRRDAETKTHRAVCSAASPLAKNVALSAVLNDLVHRQEVSAVIEGANDLKLAFDLCSNVGGHLAMIACTRSLERELA